MHNPLLQNLNEKQLAAVTLPAQSALILAGAGSGKTRVLTTRIAWLIQTQQVSPSGILAVTFTNRAAKEMLARLSAMLPISTRGMWVGTFHGLCNRLLRTHWRDAALPQTFQILDTQDQLSAIKRLLKSNHIDDEKYPPRSVMHFINHAKEQGEQAKDITPHDAYSRHMAELYQLYEDQCQREGVVDFAELLLRTYLLLSRNQPLREHYQARFSHILVDEFQDTNDLQYKWLKLMTGQRAALFAVGDDDQSIYAFRGANVGNMHAFKHEFKVKNEIKLEQNYRSHGNILDAANALIANNANRLGKNLHTDAGQGEPIRVYEATRDVEEAQWIVDEAKSLMTQGQAPDDIAVLYRANAQSRVIEHALFSAGIPYRVYGGLRFFERAEIKHAMAYLQLMDNPYNDSAFLRVVNFPARGIGARSLEQLHDIARHRGISLHDAVPYLDGKAGTALGAFVKLVDSLRFETAQLPLPEMVQHVLDASGLLAHYRAEKEGGERIENLEQLASAALQFLSDEGFGQDAPAQAGPRSEHMAGSILTLQDGITIQDADAPLNIIMSPLSAFLSHASLEAGDNQAQAGQNALQLMTVHAAKGLEFEAVFITGLEEGLFPHDNAKQEESGMEEERRLMYVAITRARRRLYLSFSQTRVLHGRLRDSLGKSRFLNEIPEDCLKWLTPKVQQQQRHWFANPKAAWNDASVHAANRIAQKIGKKSTGWRIGETVRHAKFGEGVIVNIEGSGEHARAQINFGEHGMKQLDLGVAKLERG